MVQTRRIFPSPATEGLTSQSLASQDEVAWLSVPVILVLRRGKQSEALSKLPGAELWMKTAHQKSNVDCDGSARAALRANSELGVLICPAFWQDDHIRRLPLPTYLSPPRWVWLTVEESPITIGSQPLWAGARAPSAELRRLKVPHRARGRVSESAYSRMVTHRSLRCCTLTVTAGGAFKAF